MSASSHLTIQATSASSIAASQPQPSTSTSTTTAKSSSSSSAIISSSKLTSSRNLLAEKFLAACASTPCPTQRTSPVTALPHATPREASFLSQNDAGQIFISPLSRSKNTQKDHISDADNDDHDHDEKTAMASAIRKALLHNIDVDIPKSKVLDARIREDRSKKYQLAEELSFLHLVEDANEEEKDEEEKENEEDVGGKGTKRSDDQKVKKHVRRVKPLPPFYWSASKSASVLHSFLQSEYQTSGTNVGSAPDRHPSNPGRKEIAKPSHDKIAIRSSDGGSNIKGASDVAVTSAIDMGVAHQQSELDIYDDYFLQTSSSSLSSNNITDPSSSESGLTIAHHPKLAHNNSVLLSRKPQSGTTSTTTTPIKPSTSASPPSSKSTTNTAKLDMVVVAAQQEAAAASVLKDIRASHARLRKSATSFRNGQAPVWALLAQRQGKLKPEAAAEMARARMAAATAAAVMRENDTPEKGKEITHSQSSTSSSSGLLLSQTPRSFSHPPLMDLFDHLDELEPHQDFTNEYVSPTYRSLSNRASYNLNLRRPPHRLIRPASLEVATPRARSIEKKNVRFAEGTIFHMKK